MNIDIDYARSEGDDKNYRIVVLQPSGLECLLISTNNRTKSRDEDSTKAAAAMSVQVGSFADPSAAEGCAHFLEHMVFMGSAKYPVENHYDSFVTSHGGGCNAFTEGEYTAYQFDVNAEHFDAALDIFANCFISPLLAKSAAEREINAIESEFNLAKTEDGSRLQQLFAHQANDGHVLRKFSWGSYNSLKTIPTALGVDIHEVLRSFHSVHYTPSNMKLVMMAPQGIDELAALAQACFGNWVNPFATPRSVVENASEGVNEAILKKQRIESASGILESISKVHLSSLNLQADGVSQPSSVTIHSLERCIASSRGVPLVQQSALASLTRVVPLRQTHKLVMLWQLPSFCAQYRSKPCAYIGHLMGHEGSGSALSYLKRCNFASSLSAGVSESNADDNSMFTMFEVSVILTELGLANWPTVAQIVHQYIRMMLESTPQRRIFDELQQVCATYYRYKDEEEPADYVERLAVEMLPLLGRQPRSDILGAAHLIWDWSPDSIQQVLSEFLTVRRAKVTLVSSAFQRGDTATEEAKGEGDAQAGHGAAEDESDGSDSGEDSEGSCSDASSADNSDCDASGSDSEDSATEADSDAAHEEGGDNSSTSIDWNEKLLPLFSGRQQWSQLILPPSAERIPSTEPHFGTLFWDDELPEDLFCFWEAPHTADLFLPLPNSYIPTDFALIQKESANNSTQSDADLRSPVCVPLGRTSADDVVLWHMPDITFKSPKAELIIRLASAVPLHSARSAALLDLFSRLMKDVLNEELYMASMADLDCDFETIDTGLVVKVAGFSDKACLLAASVINTINRFAADGFKTVLAETVERVKETQLRQYRNSNLKAAHCASNTRLRALKASKYSADEKAAMLSGNIDTTDGIDVAKLREFADAFTRTAVFDYFVQGNVTSERAASMVRSVLSAVPRTEQESAAAVKPPQPITQIPAHTVVVVRAVPQNPLENNSCVEVYFQLGPWNLVDSARLDLLEQLLSEPFFDDLRTKQQLGYSVSCGTRNTYGTLGFCFQVQSSKFSVEAVTTAMLAFISEMHDKVIASCAPESYSDQVEALRGNKLTPPQSLSEAARAHWSEIEDGTLCFHAARQQAALLRDDERFSQQAMSDFCREMFLLKPKLLVVQATRSASEGPFRMPVMFAIRTVHEVSSAVDVHSLFPC